MQWAGTPLQDLSEGRSPGEITPSRRTAKRKRRHEWVDGNTGIFTGTKTVLLFGANYGCTRQRWREQFCLGSCSRPSKRRGEGY